MIVKWKKLFWSFLSYPFLIFWPIWFLSFFAWCYSCFDWTCSFSNKFFFFFIPRPMIMFQLIVYYFSLIEEFSFSLVKPFFSYYGRTNECHHCIWKIYILSLFMELSSGTVMKPYYFLLNVVILSGWWKLCLKSFTRLVLKTFCGYKNWAFPYLLGLWISPM